MTEAPRFHYAEDMSWFEVETVKASEAMAYIPGAAVVAAGDDGPVLRVPWTQHSAEVLANLRVPHLPPMLRDYTFSGPFEPFAHQYQMAGAFSTHSRFFCLADMGCMKTVSSLWAVDYLLDIGAIKRVLIVCPKSIVRNVWLDEVLKSFPHRSATVLVHTDPVIRRRKAGAPSDIHITNFSGVEICYDELVENAYDLIIIDESTGYKKFGTRRFKFMAPLVARAPRCWMLTGTPSVQYPLDAYGQVKLMYPEWKMTETVFKTLTMTQHSKFRWVPKADATATIYEALQPAIVFHKRDVMKHLPPITQVSREVELSVSQKAMMRELRKASLVIVNSGQQVSAVHAAALRTKVLQIAAGSVYDDNGQVVEVDFKPRLTELLDIVEQTRREDDGVGKPHHKLIVLCPFTHTVDRVHAELQKAGWNFGKLYGDVSLVKREAILASMETDRVYDGVVAHPEVLSHGVTLTSCTTTVFFTPFDKAEAALQVQNRMDRQGQEYPMLIVKLSGCAAEDLIYRRTDARIDFHHEVVGQYSQFIEAI